MAARYRIARRTTNVTINQAAMDIAISTGQRLHIREWLLTLGSAVASTVGINRASALGTRTTPTAILPDDERDPAPTGIMLADTALAHSVQPTLAAEYLERISLPATIGQGTLWTFPYGDGLVIAVSLSAVLQNLAANGVFDSRVLADL